MISLRTGGEELETENESKFFKEFCCKRKQRIEVIDVEGIRGKRKCVTFKLGQIANRKGNFGDEIEKEFPSMSLIGKRGHSIYYMSGENDFG